MALKCRAPIHFVNILTRYYIDKICSYLFQLRQTSDRNAFGRNDPGERFLDLGPSAGTAAAKILVQRPVVIVTTGTARAVDFERRQIGSELRQMLRTLAINRGFDAAQSDELLGRKTPGRR